MKVKYHRPYGTEWEELDLETAMDVIAERAVPAGACGLTGPDGLRLTARLARVIPLGPVWRIVLEADGRTLLANVPEAPPAELAPGDEIELRVDPAAVREF